MKTQKKPTAAQRTATMKAEKSVYEKIYDAVLMIPYGRVATYGQIAAMAGNRYYARAVGNALHRNPAPDVIPCYRVVNAKGRLAKGFAFGGEQRQKQLLEAEGIEVVNNTVDLKRYGFSLFEESEDLNL